MRITNSGLVGIGDPSPAALLTVGSGDLFQVNSNGSITQAQSAVSGGQLAVSITPGAHTAVTAEVSDLAVLAHTDTITGGYTSQRFSRFMLPTISAATALTVTNAATLYVEGAPATAGVGPAAITNAYALWVDAGQSAFPAGTALLPAIIPEADPNTGIWFPAADTLAVSTAGSERVRVGSSGNVGIGTTSPGGTLDVRGDSILTDADVAHGLTGWLPTDAYGRFASTSTDGGLYVIGASDTAGQWGVSINGFIGVTDPTDTIPAVLINGAKKDGTGQAVLGASETVFQITNGGGTGQVTLLGSGNVGIGTTGPTGLLHLAGNRSASAWGLAGIQQQNAAATYTDSSTAASGTATNAVFNSFGTPTLAATNTAVTTTNAATLYIAAAPAAGTNQTLSNAYALWVDDGLARFDGHIRSTQTTAPTIGTPTSCGTSPTASVASGSTDTAGSFTVTAGTGTPGSCAVVITFNAAYITAPKSIIVTTSSSTGGAKNAYISATATTTFTVTLSTAPAASEANTWYYWVIE